MTNFVKYEHEGSLVSLDWTNVTNGGRWSEIISSDEFVLSVTLDISILCEHKEFWTSFMLKFGVWDDSPIRDNSPHPLHPVIKWRLCLDQYSEIVTAAMIRNIGFVSGWFHSRRVPRHSLQCQLLQPIWDELVAPAPRANYWSYWSYSGIRLNNAP